MLHLRTLVVSLKIFFLCYSNLVLCADDVCPTWSVPDNSTKQCICRDLKRWVVCDGTTKKVRLAYGFCMTHDSNTGETDTGRCPYTIFSDQHKSLQEDGYIELPQNVSELNEFLCGSWNREGYLCSRCKDGYGMTISNLYMTCVKCKYPNGVGWLFYFMIQLIPITVLFFVLLAFRVSIVHPPMIAYVTFCQISTALLYSYASRFHPPFVASSVHLIRVHYTYLFTLGIWGLDLLENIRGLSDFCVASNVDLQQAITLTQIKSLYPLLLVGLTYFFIVLHARNCKPVVYLWKPFQRSFSRFFRVWNPMMSLVDVFITFLLLSYSKYVMVLHFMYSFQHTYTSTGQKSPQSVLLYNPAVSYYHTAYHLPYALPLLFTLIVVATPPVMFLALYQTKPFQKCLTCIRLNNLASLHFFVNRFQSYYKDGIDGTYDLRFTASLYLILRLSIYLGSIGCNYTSLPNCELMLIFMLVFLLMLFFSLVRPYKNQKMNIIDSLLLAGLAIVCFLFIGTFRGRRHQRFNNVALIVVLVIIGVPQLVLICYVLYRLFAYVIHLKCSRPLVVRIRDTFCFCLKIKSSNKRNSVELSETLPDRIDNPYFYTNEES